MKELTMRAYGLLILLFIIGCGGGGSKEEQTDSEKIAVEIVPPQSNSQLQIPNNTAAEHYQILFIGNSHVASNDLSNLVKQMITHNMSNKLVTSEKVAGISFLSDRIDDGITYEKIKSKQWTHIVLQGQKVSSSQSILYPTLDTQTWVELVKSELLATPILFPEHPQRGHLSEGRYIQNIHLEIAKKTPACVAPIGLAWDTAIALYPNLILHHSDGNHAALTGSFLTALVFYQIITGEYAQDLPFIAEINIDSTTQIQLAQVASQTIAENVPCSY